MNLISVHCRSLLQKYIAKKTKRIRHEIVKMIAPHIYETPSILLDLISTTPRPMIVIARNYFKHTNLVGAEIGVFEGNNALNILQTLPIKTLYLIDPYFTYYVEDNISKRISLEAYNVAKEKLGKFSQIKFIIKTSDEAHKDIHEPLDFLYIDGNHTYEYVKRDITNYYPLIKSGGIMGGHDYTRDFNGVVKASKEFARENSLELNTIYPDWWFIKNE